MQPIFSYTLQFRALFYGALVFGCVIAFSPADAGLQPKLNDKFLHFVGFFGMAWLCHLAHPKTPYWLQIAGLACFGIFVEWVQSFIPSRSFSLMDWVADLAGIATYFLLLAMPMSRFLRDRCVLD